MRISLSENNESPLGDLEQDRVSCGDELAALEYTVADLATENDRMTRRKGID